MCRLRYEVVTSNQSDGGQFGYLSQTGVKPDLPELYERKNGSHLSTEPRRSPNTKTDTIHSNTMTN